MELDLAPGESRRFWKYHTPGKWFKQAKAVGKINNEKATLLFDSGAEVSIIDTTFARKVGCIIDETQKQECVGIGENMYMTEGRTKIKITLAGSLVYYFDAWVGDQVGQEAILGMDFMPRWNQTGFGGWNTLFARRSQNSSCRKTATIPINHASDYSE